jgi:hypothetical protein
MIKMMATQVVCVDEERQVRGSIRNVGGVAISVDPFYADGFAE